MGVTHVPFSLDQYHQMHLVHAEVVRERERQLIKWCDPYFQDPLFANTVLGEEVGEVATAVLERDLVNLREELIQVMACCSAWVESIDAHQLGNRS